MDKDILAAWAAATGTVAEAQVQLNQMPEGNRLLIKSKRGGPIANPLLGVIRKAQRDAVYFGNMLGLSPSVRASLAPPTLQADGHDEFEKFFK